MMFNLTHPLPESHKFVFACSGGVDSMACLHWLLNKNRKPAEVVYVDHCSDVNYSREVIKFLFNYCYIKGLVYTTLKIRPWEASCGSKEAWWRIERFKAFTRLSKLWQASTSSSLNNMPIVLAHNLDDCVEQYVINTVVRPSKTVTIRYNGPSNTIRPFRTWKKSDIIDYAKRNNLTYIEDPSNSDDSLTRNYVRHQIIPLILNVNPGLYTQVKEKVLLDKAETTVYL